MKIPLPDSLCPIQNAVGLAFFPVRKNCGEPDPRFAENRSNMAAIAENGRTSTEVNAFSAG
jgi:hypothetical protein